MSLQVVSPLSIVYFVHNIDYKYVQLFMLFSYVWEQQLLDQLTNNTWSYNHNTILQQSDLLIVEQLMKSIVTNRLTLLPIELLTDITTFRAAIATKLLSCITYILL